MSDISTLKICPVCLSGLNEGEKFKYLRKYSHQDLDFQLFECPICTVNFWFPFKNPGSEWYKNCQQNLMHRDFTDREYFLWLAQNRGITKHFFKKPPHLQPQGKKLLDVGCGTGGFLIEASKLGYQVTGVDFDSKQIEVAKSFGLTDVYCSDVVDFLNQHQNEFDVITGFEIIEHLDKPREFLRAIYNSLRSGGYICLSTPNSLRIGPKNEFWDFPYHHLTRWTKKSLKKIVELEKFKSINVADELPTNYIVSKFRVGLGVVLRKYLTKNSQAKNSTQINKEYKDTVAKLGSFKDKVLKVVITPFVWMLYFFGKRGQGLYMTAKK